MGLIFSKQPYHLNRVTGLLWTTVMQHISASQNVCNTKINVVKFLTKRLSVHENRAELNDE